MCIDEGNEQTITRLLDKSEEAFVLAVELYNRPSLKYGAESCSILLCNAWELMLKAHMIRKWGIDSIYFKDDPSRTLALSDCLKRVFTNEKDPLRVNMKNVMEFRNTNTHFITDEYDLFYGPFLQSCVENYADKLWELHNRSVSELIPDNRLALAMRRGAIVPDVIRTKYDAAVVQELLARRKDVADAIGAEGNQRIAATYETSLRLVKKKNDADLNVYIQNGSEHGIAIVKDVKDAVSFYPYTAGNATKKIDSLLKKRGITFCFNGSVKEKFTTYAFQLFTKVYEMKGDERFSYDRKTAGEKTSNWIYSEAAVEFIAHQVEKDPGHCLDQLRRKINTK